MQCLLILQMIRFPSLYGLRDIGLFDVILQDIVVLLKLLHCNRCISRQHHIQIYVTLIVPSTGMYHRIVL